MERGLRLPKRAAHWGAVRGHPTAIAPVWGSTTVTTFAVALSLEMISWSRIFEDFAELECNCKVIVNGVTA